MLKFVILFRFLYLPQIATLKAYYIDLIDDKKQRVLSGS